MRLRFVLAAAACLAATAAAAQLSEAEQRLVAAVKARSPAALELLERAARINSGSANVEGVRETGQLFRRELDALGFTTRWVDMPPEMKRAGHLVAERQGTRGKRLLLLGHLDTVFGKASRVTSWERRGDRVRGQGVSDMKGGIVVMLEALGALHGTGALDGTTITVMLTGDEESPGNPLETARAEMVALARRSDMALSFEATTRTGGQDTVVIARRAQSRWNVAVKAKPGHSMKVFSDELGYGAIYEGARILNAFREKLIEPGVTFNPGVALGGTDVRQGDGPGTASGPRNVIARDFVVQGDLRFRSPEQGERVRKGMREIVAASLPGASATIEFIDRYPAMPGSDANQALLESYSRVSQDAGFGPVAADAPDTRGAGDVQFAAPFVAALIDGLGAMGAHEHTDDEDLEIASIERGAIRAALFISRLTRP